MISCRCTTTSSFWVEGPTADRSVGEFCLRDKYLIFFLYTPFTTWKPWATSTVLPNLCQVRTFWRFFFSGPRHRRRATHIMDHKRYDYFHQNRKCSQQHLWFNRRFRIQSTNRFFLFAQPMPSWTDNHWRSIIRRLTEEPNLPIITPVHNFNLILP